MSLWDKLFGKKQDPMKAANPYIDQAIATQNPYVQQGQQAQSQLNPLLEKMMLDPNAFFEELSKGYEPSRGYQLKRDEALNAAGNSAAAGGFRGTQEDLINSTKISDRLMGEDFQQWYNNLMGIQNKGIEGSMHIGDQGYEAATNIGNLRNQQGALAYNAANNANKGNTDFLNQLMKMLATGGSAAIGGMAGGAPGAVAGAQVGSKMF